MGALTTLGPRVRAAMLLRSFAVQGSWNYRTLIGSGFAFALLPALRALYGADPAALRSAVERHEDLFNCHPYLSGLALGAVARMEADGETPEVITRFKVAVRGSLGTLGDRLVWAGWRPTCALAALLLLLTGAPWWLVIAFFLVVYNAGHVALRVWGLRMGLHYGKGIGERLRQWPLREAQHLLTTLGALFSGMVTPFILAGHLTGAPLAPPWVLGASVAALLGLQFGGIVRVPASLALGGLALLGLLLGATAS